MGVRLSSGVDRILRPVHRWIWSDSDRRVRKLLCFAEVETSGGRDILRAAEITRDPLLRRLYLAHAIDELHHGDLFRKRGADLLCAARSRPLPGVQAEWPRSGGHGLDELRIQNEPDETLLAFLHLSEKAAAGRFAIYRDVVRDDLPTQAIFEEILRDEVFHMNYTFTQLARLSPDSHRKLLWRARLRRVWKQYLRAATAVADLFGTVLLTIQYFTLVPPFAWLARRALRREQLGWVVLPPDKKDSLTRQY